MTPSALLSLWRDRWHKPPYPEQRVALVHGKLSRWSIGLARSANWGAPGLTYFTLIMATGTLVLASLTQLTVNSQIVLGWSMVAFAVYLRRHQGQVIALAIVCMAVLLTCRYFLWRLDETLPQYWSFSLCLGIALVLAEMQGWMRSALRYIGTVWPVEHPSTPLPEDAVTWPTVDVFVLSSDSSAAGLGEFLDHSAHLDWPANKYQFTVLASEPSAELAHVCASRGVAWRVYPHSNQQGTPAIINLALYESEADLVVIADCKTPLSSTLLRQTAGWFVGEPHLALVHTAHSFLAPSPTRQVLARLETTPCGVDWAIIRRNALLEVGGLRLDAPSPSRHTSLDLQGAGFFTAYLVRDSRDTSPHAFTRVNEPFKFGSLPVRLHLRDCKRMLDFYYPVAWAIFYAIPFAALCWGATPITTDFGTLMAYWLPHWILGRLALATTLEHHRLRWADFITEELSGFAVLLRTLKSFTITWTHRLWARRQSAATPSPAKSRVPLIPRPELWLGTVLCAGLGVATSVRWIFSGAPSDSLQWVYLGWSFFLALLLVASLAVQRETDWTRWANITNANRKAMLRLSSGAVYRGTITNFPAMPLRLELASGVAVTPGQWLHLSLFLNYREFVFPCQVTTANDAEVDLALAAGQLPEFRQLAASIYSRHSDWPQWLPPESADRLIPSRIARLLLHAQDAFYNLAVKSALPAALQRLRNWLKLGSTTNG